MNGVELSIEILQTGLLIYLLLTERDFRWCIGDLIHRLVSYDKTIFTHEPQDVDDTLRFLEERR